MIKVNWGVTNYVKNQYMDWLRWKWAISVSCAVLFIVGACIFVFQAMEGHFTKHYYVGMVAWIVTMLFFSFLLTYANTRIHAIERFLNFYPHRHEVRHQVFCTNHLHCLGLHYFKSFDDEVDENKQP